MANLWNIILTALKKDSPETFNKVKEELEKKEVQLAEVKTKEGKSILIEGEVAKGAPAFVMNEAGEKVTCPDGTYSTDKGTITVTGGLVAEVGAPEEAKQEAPQAAATPQAPTQFSREEAEAFLLEKLKERDAQYAALVERLNKLEQSNTVLAEMAEAIKTIEVDQKPQTKSWEEMSPLEKFRANKYGN